MLQPVGRTVGQPVGQPVGRVSACLIIGVLLLLPQPIFAAPAPASFALPPIGTEGNPKVKRLKLLITPLPGMSVAMLLEQAHQVAQREIIFRFSEPPMTSQVQFYVSADYQGRLVPILSVKVDRASWQSQSAVRLYAQPFEPGIRLLGLQPMGQPESLNRSIGRNQSRRDDIAFRDD
jgi:hypothetical protein